eukprot:448047-Rhodomonas_salina.2
MSETATIMQFEEEAEEPSGFGCRNGASMKPAGVLRALISNITPNSDLGMLLLQRRRTMACRCGQVHG